jgi:hypothetical protein
MEVEGAGGMTRELDTGYRIREGSRILAERRAERERCEAVAEAMLRRWKIQRLARRALAILDGEQAA